MKIAERIRNWHDDHTFDEDGFSELSKRELAKRIKELGGQLEDCRCGSPYCEICNGSIDPSLEVKFPDGSVLYIGNPRQEVFPRILLTR